ncbi:MAG: carbohydrate binding family 9 domain-containing protein [Bacteroidales bacterium]|nr:carbohydrate binding family 9 domain-containing protein [Bacteroidales bacterium]
MRQVRLKKFVLAAAIILLPLAARSQEQISIPRISGELKFDGIVDDASWNGVGVLPMVMHTPTFGNNPSEKSEVMICYDNTYIYVGARLYDSEANGMLITSKKRDEGSNSNESLSLVFDSFNDKENALVFSTTPSGLRNDLTVLNDGIASNPRNPPFNNSWNTFWDVKTTMDENGWYLEMRIPFSSMRFKENNGKVVMGLICFRRIAHKNEIDIYPAIPPDWGVYSTYRPSMAKEIEFEGIKSKKPFYLAPYAITGFQQDNTLNETKTGYDLKGSPKINAGLDAKYGITNNLTLDVTLNTDFAQVEADDQQVNLTRFSLFFPEKRTFFQERSSIFNFGFEGKNNLFYSRRIGLNRGEQVPILGGARITGMAGKWDIGFLDMQTNEFDPSDQAQSTLPSENFSVLRLRRQVINRNSYVGGILTNRLGMDGTYNSAYGLDGIFKILKNDYLNLKVAQVMAKNAENNPASIDPTRVFFNWKRYNDRGLGYDFIYTISGKDFKPEIGYQQRNNYSYYSGMLQYGWIPGESSLLLNHKFEFSAFTYTDNLSGNTQSSEFALKYNFFLKSGYNGMLEVNNAFENVEKLFSFAPDADVPVGKYNFSQFETHLHSPDSKSILVNLDAFAGNFYDGNRFTVALEPNWNIGSTLQLSVAYEYNKVNFDERNQSFTGNIVRFKALAMFTTKLSVSSFIQYNSVDNALVNNLRLRYNPKEGNDFFIVYNEGRNTYRSLEDPRLPTFNNRSILLKYTYTFTL